MAYGGRVVSYDASGALKISGHLRVVEIPGTPPRFETNARLGRAAGSGPYRRTASARNLTVHRPTAIPPSMRLVVATAGSDGARIPSAPAHGPGQSSRRKGD